MTLNAENICYYLLGIGTLMPWNAFITAADYYALQFPGKHVDRLITVLYLPLNLIALSLFVLCHDARYARLRIVVGFTVFSIAMLLVPLLDSLDVQSLGLLLSFVAVSGAADGAAQGALFGVAAVSRDSAINTQMLISGTSTSGVIVCLIRLGTKGIFHGEEGVTLSSNLYFLISGLICVCCTFIFCWVLSKYDHDISRLYVFDASDITNEESSSHGLQEEAQDHYLGLDESRKRILSIEESSYPIENDSFTKINAQALEVSREIIHPMIALVVCYVVTLSIFPGVLAEDLGQDASKSWYPIILIFAFNVSDFIGKMCPPGVQSIFASKNKVLTISVLRALFIPLFLIAAHSSVSTPFVSILTILLGLTNGALTTVCMVFAPTLVSPDKMDLCGNLTVLALVVGLNLGAFSGFLWLL
ncbi:Equilibrative nucleotide transporter 8 [Picochlorum sp. SENEW3]|nr:Equilibrative nucleotide transporter 8 [Picochlorum sp. SENEW3]